MAIDSDGLAHRISRILPRVAYRRIETERDRNAVYRLRYEAYRRKGLILSNADGLFRDKHDYDRNAIIFGCYLDGILVATIRIHTVSSIDPSSPTADAFTNELRPQIDAGKRLIDPNRLAIDSTSPSYSPELLYIILRITYMACIESKADIAVAGARSSHCRLYNSLFFMRRVTTQAKPFPPLSKPYHLMAVDFPAMKDPMTKRNVFLESSADERSSILRYSTSEHEDV